MQFVSKLNVFLAYTQWEFFVWLRSRAGPPVAFAITLTLTGRGSTQAQAHTRIESKRERERLSSRDTRHTNRRRVDVRSGTCVWCVCLYVTMRACMGVCVCLSLAWISWRSLSLSLSSSHSHTRISLFATSLRFSYCCCCYCCYYYNYLLIQYLELSTAFINSCSWLLLSPLSLLSLTLTHTLPIACTAEYYFVSLFFCYILHLFLLGTLFAVVLRLWLWTDLLLLICTAFAYVSMYVYFKIYILCIYCVFWVAKCLAQN